MRPRDLFDLLRDVIGEEQVETRIVPGFPLKDLTRPENFLSLMHYFGLLSIRDVVERCSRSTCSGSSS